MSPRTLNRLIGGAVILLVLVLAGAQSTYIVEPGFRGVQVTLGKVSPDFKPEGFGVKTPFISTVIQLSVRQQTVAIESVCVSKDLQQVSTRLSVLYRVPEASVVEIFQKFKGDPFTSLVAPRVDEALKEVTKEHTAQEIVQKRAEVKTRAVESARRKIGDMLEVVDVVMENISLSAKLESAIERKMVQEQEANKAVFAQQQAQVEAETAIIKAKGEAESIQIRGEALSANAAFLDLQVVETWNGKLPRVVGGNVQGTQMLLPLPHSLAPAPSPAVSKGK